MNKENIILYATKDGKAKVELYELGESVYLSQDGIAKLFDTSKSSISEHISHILKDGELSEDSVVRNYRITASESANEIIVSRADENAVNMNLTSWKGNIVRKGDIIIAKNYLNKNELDMLNRLVMVFLEQAEIRVKDNKTLTMNFWKENVDNLLKFQGKDIMQGSVISNAKMEQIVYEKYEIFDAKRKKQEAIKADEFDELELLNYTIKRTQNANR